MKLSDIPEGPAPSADQKKPMKLSDVPDAADQGPKAAPKAKWEPDVVSFDRSQAGYEGAATRALAVPTAGAAIGAGLGTFVFPGVGTTAGAAAGLIAGAGTEAVIDMHNLLAPALGWDRWASPQEKLDQVLDFFHVARPQTTGQRMFGSAVSAGTGSAGVAKAAETLAPVVAERVAAARAATPAATVAEAAKQVRPSKLAQALETTAESPGKQAVAGAAGGTAAQGAAELGAPPWLSALAGITATTAMPFAARVAFPGAPSDPAMAAHQAGYVIHPGEITREPDIASETGAAVSGKIKTQQEASLRNREVTNALAREDLGLSRATPLTDDTFENIRSQAGQAYKNIEKEVPFIMARQEDVGPVITPTEGDPFDDHPLADLPPAHRTPLERQFGQDIKAITEDIGGTSGPGRGVGFPSEDVPKITRLQNILANLKVFTPEQGLNAVKRWRFQAKTYFLSRDDPEKLWMAKAYTRAADAVEDLMDRQFANIDPSHPGAKRLIADYKAARERIAKTYAVQSSMRGENVDASRLAAMDRVNAAGTRRSRLTGGLKTIADTYVNFPKDLNPNAQPTEPVTVVDAMIAASGIGAGHFATGLWPFVRPLARRTILSPGWQRWVTEHAQNLRENYPWLDTRGNWPIGVARTMAASKGQETGDEQGNLYPYYGEEDPGYAAILSGGGLH